MGTDADTLPALARRRQVLVRWPLRLLLVAGLAVDAVVHGQLGIAYGGFSGELNQATLFLIETAASALAALLVLLSDRRVVAGFALLVAASALGAVLLYRYVDVGSLGPIPNMYEPLWFPQKTISAIAEAVATVAALALLVIPRPCRERE